jgi:hypothetical protein
MHIGFHWQASISHGHGVLVDPSFKTRHSGAQPPNSNSNSNSNGNNGEKYIGNAKDMLGSTGMSNSQCEIAIDGGSDVDEIVLAIESVERKC